MDKVVGSISRFFMTVRPECFNGINSRSHSVSHDFYLSY